MTTDKMDYIFAVAEEQNLTRAAKRLYIAQSTLTMYINRIENELGIKLFDRSRSPITPTPAGLVYIEEMRKIRLVEDSLYARLKQMASPSETLSIGIGPIRSNTWMPLLLPPFLEKHPKTTVSIIERGDETLIDGLLSGTMDVVVGSMTANSDGYNVVELALEQVLLILPRSFGIVPEWVLANNSSTNPYEIDPHSLDGLPIITPGVANDLYSFTARMLNHYMIQTGNSITTNNMRTAASLVAKGMGYQFTSPVLLETCTEAERSNLVFCTLRSMQDTRKLIACYKQSCVNEELILDFISLVEHIALPNTPGMHPL